jgi:hypothetical protein
MYCQVLVILYMKKNKICNNCNLHFYLEIVSLLGGQMLVDGCECNNNKLDTYSRNPN